VLSSAGRLTTPRPVRTGITAETVRIERLLSDYTPPSAGPPPRLSEPAGSGRPTGRDARKLQQAARPPSRPAGRLAADRDAAEREMLGQQVRQAELDG